MGRNEDRQVRKFKFGTYKINVYRPTEGQMAVLGMISEKGKKGGQETNTLLRFFQVLESLVVETATWDQMDESLVDGSSSIGDFTELMAQVFSYDWDSPEAKQEELVRKMKVQQENA